MRIPTKIKNLAKKCQRKNHFSRVNSHEAQKKQLARAKKFICSVAPVIIFTVPPYMGQMNILGNINKYAFSCFCDEMHRAVRLNKLFSNDLHLVEISADSALSPGGKFC